MGPQGHDLNLARRTAPLVRAGLIYRTQANTPHCNALPAVDPNRSTQRTEADALDKFYWDEHGRRYARRPCYRSVDIDLDDDGHGGDVGDDRDGPAGEVGVAMEAVR